MPYQYILDEVAQAVGLTSLSLNPDQKVWLDNKINRAAEEFYESDDIPGCLRECFITTRTNVELALPPFMGELRAVREVYCKQPIRLIDLRPRYHANLWVNEWRAFNFKGYSPVKTEITNATAPVAEIEVADDTVEVTIVGSTLTANRVSQTITLDGTTNPFTTAFVTYESITVNKLPESNITIKDGNGVELATIFNDTLEARYQLYDISMYPFASQSNTDCWIFEALYKLPLKRMENPSDCFPVPGFDNIVIMKSLQLLTEQEEGKEQRAVLIDKKAAIVLKQKIENKTGSVEKVLNYPRRKTLGMFSPNNYWTSWNQ